MAAERGQELAMLEMAVKPGIRKARECFRAGNADELERIVRRDIIGLLQDYRQSELTKYGNIPESLKTAPKMEQMQQAAELYGSALGLLWNQEEDSLRAIDENVLNRVEGLVDAVIKLFEG